MTEPMHIERRKEQTRKEWAGIRGDRRSRTRIPRIAEKEIYPLTIPYGEPQAGTIILNIMPTSQKTSVIHAVLERLKSDLAHQLIK